MAHFLLIYDRDAGALLSQNQFPDAAQAMEARFAAESQYRGRPEVEIVALAAESEADLMITHARYFMSLSELAHRRS